MGQQWPECDLKVQKFVHDAIQILNREITQKLSAIILHGSLAMGSFYPPKSDIDLLILVNKPLDLPEQKSIHQKMILLCDKRPIVGFLEFSIVLSGVAKNPIHPINYELHFGEEFPEKISNGEFDYSNARGRDPDLAAHFMVAKRRGISLLGDTPETLLGDIDWSDYLDSVFDDLNWILSCDHILVSPFYGVLNSCRVLQMLANGPGTVSNKEEGAIWALENLPSQYREIITFALNSYRSDKKVLASVRQKAGLIWNEAKLINFRDFVAEKISQYNQGS